MPCMSSPGRDMVTYIFIYISSVNIDYTDLYMTLLLLFFFNINNGSFFMAYTYNSDLYP